MAGAFASYYWAFKKPEDIPANPIFASLGRALRSVGVLGGVAYLWEGAEAHFCFVLPPPGQIPHRFFGFWISDPVSGPGDQGPPGVPGSQAERSGH